MHYNYQKSQKDVLVSDRNFDTSTHLDGLRQRHSGRKLCDELLYHFYLQSEQIPWDLCRDSPLATGQPHWDTHLSLYVSHALNLPTTLWFLGSGHAAFCYLHLHALMPQPPSLQVQGGQGPIWCLPSVGFVLLLTPAKSPKFINCRGHSTPRRSIWLQDCDHAWAVGILLLQR